jgi:hypothetical protein
MGVFANSGVNFSEISSEMGKTLLNWMNATIQIIDPNTGDANWDPFTNTETGSEPTALWQGKVRIQSLRSSNATSTPEVAYSQIGVRGMRVQMPIDAEIGFIRKGLQIVVIDGGNDPELEQLQFIIESAINSSYAWNRTIECKVDIKSVANSTWSSIAGNVVGSNAAPITNATVRTFRHADGMWLLEYETTTDVRGNYQIPADPAIPVIVAVSKTGYVTKYYNNASTPGAGTLITPVNHIETSGINFILAGV